jgi:predicted LPLAT superfamily acyltransferase
VLHPRYVGRRDKVGQLQPWVQEFATLMESYAEQHPYQCFLFRDVWKEEGDGARA